MNAHSSYHLHPLYDHHEYSPPSPHSEQTTNAQMLSLVLPTYNEAQSLPALVDLLDGVLQSVPHEIIIVDDNSPDGTWRVAQSLSQHYPSLRVIRRIGAKGLSSAVVDGFDAAHGDILAVMDADGQHDPALFPLLLAAVESGADIAIGSRYVQGGSVGEWVTDRRIISKLGTFFATAVSSVRVSDPLGGFFLVRAELLKGMRDRLKPTGFKILLEILAHAPRTATVREVPLVFRPRLHGESKLSLTVHFAFFVQFLRLGFLRLARVLRQSGALLFGLVSLIIFAVLVPRAWLLLPLYTDAALRTEVQDALMHSVDHKGWLLSDVSLLSVTREKVLLSYRPHLRISAPTQQCTMMLHPVSLSCVDD